MLWRSNPQSSTARLGRCAADDQQHRDLVEVVDERATGRGVARAGVEVDVRIGSAAVRTGRERNLTRLDERDVLAPAEHAQIADPRGAARRP